MTDATSYTQTYKMCHKQYLKGKIMPQIMSSSYKICHTCLQNSENVPQTVS